MWNVFARCHLCVVSCLIRISYFFCPGIDGDGKGGFGWDRECMVGGKLRPWESIEAYICNCLCSFFDERVSCCLMMETRSRPKDTFDNCLGEVRGEYKSLLSSPLINTLTKTTI